MPSAALPGGFAWQTGGSLPVQLFQMLVVATCLAHRPPVRGAAVWR